MDTGGHSFDPATSGSLPGSTWFSLFVSVLFGSLGVFFGGGLPVSTFVFFCFSPFFFFGGGGGGRAPFQLHWGQSCDGKVSKWTRWSPCNPPLNGGDLDHG